jgi:maltose/moltooligosaccharide transporter
MPEMVASLGFGWVMNHLLGNNRLAAVVGGGIFFVVAAVLAQRVDETAGPVRDGPDVRGLATRSPR